CGQPAMVEYAGGIPNQDRVVGAVPRCNSPAVRCKSEAIQVCGIPKLIHCLAAGNFPQTNLSGILSRGQKPTVGGIRQVMDAFETFICKPGDFLPGGDIPQDNATVRHPRKSSTIRRET